MGIFAPYPNPFDDVLAEIDREINAAFQQARDTIGDATDWVAQAAITSFEWLVERWNEFVSWVETNLGGFGNPDDLDTARDAWAGAIRDTGLIGAESINAEALATDNKWEGDGADAYNDRVPTQSARLHDFSSMAQRISDAVSDLSGAMSGAITAMWVALDILLASIAATALQLAGIITIPTAIATLLVSFATAIITLKGSQALYASSVDTATAAFGAVSDDDLKWPRITV